MNNFWSLTGYELRKILKRKSSMIAMLIFFVIALYTVISPISYSYSKTDINFAKNLSDRILDSALIFEAVEAYQTVPTDASITSYDTEEYQQNAKPYGAIIAAISPAYFDERSGSISEIQNIDTQHFYEYRNKLVAQHIDISPVDEKTKNYLLEENAKLETPFTFQYADGYMYFLGYVLIIGVLSFFLTSFLISPIFAGEYGRTDDILLSSKNGKKSLIFAKIFSSFLITIGVFSLICLTIYFGCMFLYGFDGSSGVIQLLFMECPYPLTILQTVFYAIIGVLSISIFSTAFNLLLSSKLKSSLVIMGIMFCLGIGTQMLGVPKEAGILYKIYLLMPGNSITYWELIDTICYRIGDFILPPYLFIPIFTSAATLILIPFIFKGFKNHQVG